MTSLTFTQTARVPFRSTPSGVLQATTPTCWTWWKAAPRCSQGWMWKFYEDFAGIFLSLSVPLSVSVTLSVSVSVCLCLCLFLSLSLSLSLHVKQARDRVPSKRGEGARRSVTSQPYPPNLLVLEFPHRFFSSTACFFKSYRPLGSNFIALIR